MVRQQKRWWMVLCMVPLFWSQQAQGHFEMLKGCGNRGLVAVTATACAGIALGFYNRYCLKHYVIDPSRRFQATDEKELKRVAPYFIAIGTLMLVATVPCAFVTRHADPLASNNWLYTGSALLQLGMILTSLWNLGDGVVCLTNPSQAYENLSQNLK